MAEENVFTRKLGPLPVWGWGVVGAGVVTVWRMFTGGESEEIVEEEPYVEGYDSSLMPVGGQPPMYDVAWGQPEPIPTQTGRVDLYGSSGESLTIEGPFDFVERVLSTTDSPNDQPPYQAPPSQPPATVPQPPAPNPLPTTIVTSERDRVRAEFIRVFGEPPSEKEDTARWQRRIRERLGGFESFDSERDRVRAEFIEFFNVPPSEQESTERWKRRLEVGRAEVLTGKRPYAYD